MKKILIVMCALLVYGCAQEQVELPAPNEDAAQTRAYDLKAGTITPESQRIATNSTPEPLYCSAATSTLTNPQYVYQWQTTTTPNVDSSWGNISGATTSDYQPPVSSSAGIKYYRRKVSDRTGQILYSNTASIECIYFSVSSSSQEYYVNMIPWVPMTGQPSGVSFSTTLYQWQKRFGTNPYYWDNVEGATTNNFYPATSASVRTDYYRLRIADSRAPSVYYYSNTATVVFKAADPSTPTPATPILSTNTNYLVRNSSDYLVVTVTNPPIPGWDSDASYEWETNGVDYGGYGPKANYGYFKPLPTTPSSLMVRVRVAHKGKLSQWSSWAGASVGP